MERVRAQLFLPAQAQREFWLNRDSVLRQVRDRNSARELAAAQKTVEQAIDAAAQLEIDSKQQGALLKKVKDVFGEVKLATSRKSAADRATQALINPASDVVLYSLERLFDGRVGREYGPEQLSRLMREADARFAQKIPPGYMDAEKPNGGYGDYVVWAQLLDKAETSSLPIVFVTNDTKEDWWRKLDSKTPINARFELVHEMRRRADVGFATLTFDEFVSILSEDPGSGIVESALDDEGLDEDRVQADDTEEWTLEEFTVLIGRLSELGFIRQVATMRAAAATQDGVLQRGQVLQLLGLAKNAKLTGFTRPIRRVQLSLIADGLLREGLTWALQAGYDGPGKAQRFKVPLEIAEVFTA
jgi:hypothetical protein